MKTKEELEKELIILKQKHKTVFSLSPILNEEGETVTLFLKKPDRNTRGIISKLQGDTGKQLEATLKNLYIGGDLLSTVITNDDALFSCEDGIVEILTVQKAELKKN